MNLGATADALEYRKLLDEVVGELRVATPDLIVIEALSGIDPVDILLEDFVLFSRLGAVTLTGLEVRGIAIAHDCFLVSGSAGGGEGSRCRRTPPSDSAAPVSEAV